MILADTSAWIEYLRATGSDVDLRLTGLLEEETPVGITEVVIMEVAAGARDDRHAGELRALLYRSELLTIAGIADYEEAASLYQACRRGGETVRKMTDCLVAAVAIRLGTSVLHRDADFDVLARHTPLEVAG